jgi:hypothetical protein
MAARVRFEGRWRMVRAERSDADQASRHTDEQRYSARAARSFRAAAVLLAAAGLRSRDFRSAR